MPSFKKYFTIILEFDGSSSDIITSINKKFLEFQKGNYSFTFNADGHQKYDFIGTFTVHSSIEFAEDYVTEKQKIKNDTTLFFVGVGNIFDSLNPYHYLTKIFVMNELSKTHLAKRGNGKVPNLHPRFESNTN